MLHLTNFFYFRFFFSNLTILHITNSVLKIWLLFMTLHYYTLLWNIFEKYFSVLQNYTLLQTFCFCSKYFVWTLQYYTLQIIYLRFFFSNLTILHIIFEFSWKYFSVLQNYTLLQTICFCSKYFFWTLQYYTLRIVIFQIFLFQPYNITHYFEYFQKYFSLLQNYTLLQTFFLF